MKELIFEVTAKNYKRAIRSNSGACIVADAIRATYPQFSKIKVNLATIRVTDVKKGERYTYITPPSVGQTLLYYDQGWNEKNLPKRLRVRDLARITPITRSASSTQRAAERRAKRLAELEEKKESGIKLTSDEKRSLTRLQKPFVQRPTNEGKRKAEGKEPHIVIRGGRELVIDPRRTPQLLGGKSRHFGAKLAEPGEVFADAVEKASEKRIKEAVEEALRAEREKQG
jgi:hypothetical protein